MKTNRNTALLVSPHFDDAVFSAGGFMSECIKRGDRVIVVNVFTSCGEGRNSYSARRYLNKCGYSDAFKLYKDRQNEDKAVLDSLGARQINLGWVEALWRTKQKSYSKAIPELELLYPIYPIHVKRGKIHNEDILLVSRISSELKKIIAANNVNIILGPRGIGKHVDHIITKEAVLQTGFKRILLWDDYPYNIRQKNTSEPVLKIKPNWNEKSEMLKGYKTQFDALFPNGVIEQDETFTV